MKFSHSSYPLLLPCSRPSNRSLVLVQSLYKRGLSFSAARRAGDRRARIGATTAIADNLSALGRRSTNTTESPQPSLLNQSSRQCEATGGESRCIISVPRLETLYLIEVAAKLYLAGLSCPLVSEVRWLKRKYQGKCCLLPWFQGYLRPWWWHMHEEFSKSLTGWAYTWYVEHLTRCSTPNSYVLKQSSL